MSYIADYIRYIDQTPTAYQAVAVQKETLSAAGFTELQEKDPWKLKRGGSYFVTRNASSLIAFSIPSGKIKSARIVASHADSPAFKIKNDPEMKGVSPYVTLNVEEYGGTILSTWFDRPLSVAGRVFVKKRGKAQECPVDLAKEVCLIPSLAIHLDRDVNKGHAFQIQKELLPLLTNDPSVTLNALIAKALGVKEESIVSADLFAYNRMAPKVWGAKDEFLSAPRLDDSACAYASLTALLKARSASLTVHAVFDNEEVGSSSLQGACGTFLKDTLHRIALGLGLNEEEEMRMLSESFLLSADNAHALHPNVPEKSDPKARPVLGGGVVLKFSGNQKYTTDAYSAAVVRMLAEGAKITLQDYHNHSDLPGGSTLGNLSIRQVGVHSADIGVPQLAMHSAYETCAVSDLSDMVKLMKQHFAG